MKVSNYDTHKTIDSAILAIVSDLHTNSVIGLPPGPEPFEKDEGDQHHPNKYQQWLWSNWLDYWSRIDALKKETGLPVVAVFNGDVFDGDHHNTYQIITRNPGEMLDIAELAMAPAVDVADKLYILRGTPVHVGGEGWLEETLAKRIGAEKANPGRNRRTEYRMVMAFGNWTIDIQHHPESSDVRPWTKGNGAVRIANILLSHYVNAGMFPPDVAVRSHKHVWSESGDNHPTRVFCLPSWQGVTEFVHRIGQGSHPAPSVGGMYFIIRDGVMTAHEALRYRPAVNPPTRPTM